MLYCVKNIRHDFDRRGGDGILYDTGYAERSYLSRAIDGSIIVPVRENDQWGKDIWIRRRPWRSGSANAPAPGPELLSGKWAALILLYLEDGPIRCIGPLRTEPGCGIYEDRKAGGDTRPIGRIPPPGPGGLHTEPMTQIKTPFAAGSQPGGFYEAKRRDQAQTSHRYRYPVITATRV